MATLLAYDEDLKGKAWFDSGLFPETWFHREMEFGGVGAPTTFFADAEPAIFPRLDASPAIYPAGSARAELMPRVDGAVRIDTEDA